MMKSSFSGILSVLLFVLAVNLSFVAHATDYYVSVSGSDSNAGTQDSPFLTIQQAFSVVAAGDHIYLRGGTFEVTNAPVVITTNGTSTDQIQVSAYSGETPILHFDGVVSSSNRGIVQDADYWIWDGVIFENAGDNGMLLSGNNNTIKNCIFRENKDTGLQLSRYNTSAASIEDWPSNNLIENCESYDNKDPDNEDADGFAAKLTCGVGNIFRACVSHHNIDDGWDLYTKTATGPIGEVLFEDCIAHHNGTLTDGVTSGGGDKNGYKLGSSAHQVNHELRRCIAFSNGKHGFTDNGNIGNIKFYNLTSYNNGDYNFHTRDNATHTFRNCISLDANNDRIVGDAPTSNNYFEGKSLGDYVVTSADFVTMTAGPHATPTANGFLNLKETSPCVDKGVVLPSVSYSGASPDMGAIEYGGTTIDPTGFYTLSTSVTGSGTVSGEGVYAEGEVVTVTANPAYGWKFSNWTGDLSSTDATTTITMDADKSVTAVFVESDDPVGGEEGDVVHNFTESGLSSSFFTIVGNLSTSKGTVSYLGLTLTQCLKIESSTSISFALPLDASLTLVFNEGFSGEIKIDGTSQTITNGILTTDLTAGDHTITKDVTANLYYMSITYGGSATSAIVLNAEAGDGQVDLSWTSVNVEGELSVYRDTDDDPTDRELIATLAEGSTVYTDNAVTNGTTYYYWVSAVDADSNTIESDAVSATPAEVVEVYYNLSVSTVGDGSVNITEGSYLEGTEVTLEATASGSDPFLYWSGDVSSSSTSITVTMNSDKDITAHFGEIQTPDVDESMIGYATVPGDGIPTTTGGAGGAEITISTLAQLETWAEQRENNTTPEIVYIVGKITSSASTIVTIKHGANISILGLDDTAELENVGLNIRNYDNVIVRNIKIHEVLYPNDALTLDEVSHAWVDHLELHSLRGDGVTYDTYDGLLDIKKGARYITVSWCYIHDHMKTVLIGHTNNTGQQVEDSEMRITFHHNHFYNTDGRNPSLRYGAAHLFNNYFDKIDDYGLAARVGAHALVENCHYNDVKLSMSTDKFPVDGLPNGYICQTGNLFTGTTGQPIISQTGCEFWDDLPYTYTLDDVSTVSTNVPANVGVGKVESLMTTPQVTGVDAFAKHKLSIFPNPAKDIAQIRFILDKTEDVSVKIFDMHGKQVDFLAKKTLSVGEHTLNYNVSGLQHGNYILQLQVGSKHESHRLMVK